MIFVLGSFVLFPPGPDFQPSLAMIIPPIRTKGVAKIQTSAILHSKIAEMVIPAKIARTDSMSTAVVSVVSPFKLVISSERMFDRIPGALSFRSYHDTCLYIKDEKS